MKISIIPTRLISEVQQDFNKMFPFLKLLFFKYSIQKQQENIFDFDENFSENHRIGICQRAMANGVVEITESMKVKDLEKLFSDQFGLNVQVFRRSGNLWLQTTMTDDWTLQNQNEHGMEICRALKTFLETEADINAASQD